MMQSKQNWGITEATVCRGDISMAVQFLLFIPTWLVNGGAINTDSTCARLNKIKKRLLSFMPQTCHEIPENRSLSLPTRLIQPRLIWLFVAKWRSILDAHAQFSRSILRRWSLYEPSTMLIKTGNQSTPAPLTSPSLMWRHDTTSHAY